MSFLPFVLTLQQALIRSSEYHHNNQSVRLGAIGQATKGIVSIIKASKCIGLTFMKVFMGTPHRGSSSAQLAGLVASIARIAFRQHPNERLINALRQDSDLLEHNRRSFASISDNLPIGSFFESEGFMTMGLVGGLMCIKRCELIRVIDRGTILCITGHVQRNRSHYPWEPYGYVQICIEGGYGIYKGCLSD